MFDTDVFLALNFDPAIKKVKNFDSMNEKTLRVTIHIKEIESYFVWLCLSCAAHQDGSSLRMKSLQ